MSRLINPIFLTEFSTKQFMNFTHVGTRETNSTRAVFFERTKQERDEERGRRELSCDLLRANCEANPMPVETGVNLDRIFQSLVVSCIPAAYVVDP